jgi:hypothetical protein
MKVEGRGGVLLQQRQRLSADHPAIRHDDDPAEAEASPSRRWPFCPLGTDADASTTRASRGRIKRAAPRRDLGAGRSRHRAQDGRGRRAIRARPRARV